MSQIVSNMKMIRYLRLAAISAAAIALPVGASATFEYDQTQLYPICAPGRIIYAPFPGGGKKENPGHDGVCHAARVGDRVKLVPLNPKNC